MSRVLRTPISVLLREVVVAYFLFIDESGREFHDQSYEVLAGVAIEDRDLWNLVKEFQELEIKHFGVRYTLGQRELKAKKILKSKVFRHAGETDPIPLEERRALARQCLLSGPTAGFRQMCALAQAKLAYVDDVLETCGRFRCKAFASIVKNPGSASVFNDYLRKDYAYLFERFFYFLEDTDPNASGIIVFDELEKSKSHLLVQQMDRYFKRTAKGQQRAGQIIPEPFFVHSDLTTGIQLADIAAYLLSWGFRTGDLAKPKRDNLTPFVDRLCRLRHRTVRHVDGIENFEIWSLAVISDLRTRDEQFIT